VTTARLAHIVRHPVKSVGWQELERVVLTQGRPLPFDRHWAVAHRGAPFEGDPDGWQPKMCFARGAAEGRLQAIRADFDDLTGHIRLTHPDQPDFTGILPDAGRAVVHWLRPLWPETRPALDRLVSRGDGGALGDCPDPFVAVLNLSSNRALGQRMGRDLSIHRWRGNLWLEGLAPWEEFDLIGQTLTIGPARLRIVERIGRCVATCADPATGKPGGDTLAALEAAYDHTDFGVYAIVEQGGEIALGDTVTRGQGA
jgi:uncharacterized protein YcbX